MDKWEYLSFHASGGMSRIFSNISPEYFSAAFPAYKVKAEENGVIVIRYKTGETAAFANSVLDYLGSQGWEAYAVHNSVYYFKRKV